MIIIFEAVDATRKLVKELMANNALIQQGSLIVSCLVFGCLNLIRDNLWFKLLGTSLIYGFYK